MPPEKPTGMSTFRTPNKFSLVRFYRLSCFLNGNHNGSGLPQRVHDLARAFSDGYDFLEQIGIFGLCGDAEREFGEAFRIAIENSGCRNLDVCNLSFPRSNRGE